MKFFLCRNKRFIYSSSVGGLILDYAVSNYDGIAVFQPIINGKNFIHVILVSCHVTAN